MIGRKLPQTPPRNRPLDVEEIRLVADLRVMHAKVDELYQIVQALRERHSEADVHGYADQPVLSADIEKVDQIYLWFVALKEQQHRRDSSARKY